MNARQCLVVGIMGTELDDETRARLRDLQPGGYILFSRNIKEPNQLRDLIDDLRDLSDIPPIVCVDQEGGRVARLREMGAEPPWARQLRDHGDRKLIERHGTLTGQLLRLFGFNLDLCPVLDISFDDEADNSLWGRTWGKSVEEVCTNAGTFNDAMRAEGIFSCAKHFPGYSGATLDPHYHLPVVERTREELEANEWAPYRALQDRLDTIMMGHASYPLVDDSDLPTSLSPKIVQGILREDWGFEGCIVTDDLDMGAVLEAFPFEELLPRAIDAGNDLLLVCHRLSDAYGAGDLLERLPRDTVKPALERIKALKARLPDIPDFDLAAYRALDDATYQLRVDTLGEEGAKERSTCKGSHSPVEAY